ncbi:MAG: PVC-type heme-binding CxxCH protein [Verrucomicrobiota bacterium]|nr:PVC-type heme-binding CxxCH protein [Verrucomicrobiota bacterium]MED5471697.1 PVC-type heme-binding CxxCH protein [Verrucomicrobiota bacterium]MEE2966523.1 PVC-type heme-binding CxxCH protein [Verrucomicrobiota bacterium]
MPKTYLGILTALSLIISSSAALAKFEFKKGDSVCLIGNSLPDRFNHDGWFEAVLQSELKGKEVRFRNLGFTGDTVKERPRNQGFPSPETYLKICEADVIFAFFGYNESFKGEKGLESFMNDLSGMIDNYTKLKPNGESAPRIVLFSPIAHENLNSPNLPDGKANNVRLEEYSKAIKAVADKKSVTFVDLFNPTKELYSKTKEALTINGVHLNALGNRHVAQVIAEGLLGKTVKVEDDMEKLRRSVTYKNWFWFNRYRATDGNDVWGGRSGLKFVDGQSNADVLRHELKMLDVMTSNRDPKIWATALGSNFTVDDSNVPPPVAVKSNIGGKSRSSNKSKEGNAIYSSPEETLKKLRVPEGFKVNLFAHEKMFPELVNPVQMSVDTKGRLWVAAWKTYPKWEPLKEMSDRLLILPDEDRDGVADKAITFAKIHNPTGFEFWNGGVLVGSAPDIWFLKDTDGDDVADLRIKMVGGIDSADTHHAMNNFQYGPDGGLYYQRGVFHVSNVETPWTTPHKSGASAMYRFNPRTFTFSQHAGNSPNPHGISFDRWGYHYATDGTGGRSYQVVPKGNGFAMRGLLKKEVRPVASSGIISSANFPDDKQQCFMLCNTIGFLGLKHYKLTRNPETGEVNGQPLGDLFVSDDRNVRPSDADFGSDGALYVSDWHNVIIGHMQHNIRDPQRDHNHGRIYRVVNTAKPLQKPVSIDGEPINVLLNNLKHPIDGVRYRTRIELSEHPTDPLVEEINKWVSNFDAKNPTQAHHMLEALWVLQAHNVKDDKLMGTLLTSADPNVRRAAKTVQHFWYNVDFTRGGGELAKVKEDKAPEPKVVVQGNQTIVDIAAIPHQLKYNLNNFSVKAGSKVKITFLNPDVIPHNLLIVEPGSRAEIGNQAIAMGADAVKKAPKNSKILHGTKMLEAGQKETLEFTAPSKPGDYEFICTFPGHWAVMNGIMKVTP